ncbi:hypothetical protein EUX98_g5809 [Antrodiella citrinella]|uniref:Uncharacterized protein n=1 Tax=Antrodiella citrinella TaxID=2447956 RepID=A0A4S4MRJ0_9APHY|nr:hypothetical protein EUX98_g5809 [Antrodiella citrinella]
MPISPFLGRSKSLVSDPKEALPRASTSSIFPTLHKLNTGPPNTRRPVSQPTGASSSTANNGPPTPLVSLRLSGPSFLDVVIRDRADKEPVYIIETVSDSTLIYRLDTTTDNAHKVATVQWPNSVIKSKTKSGRTIQMADGRWRDAEDLLKLGPLGSVATRKFSIPHYPHQMKWKLIPGGHFYCTTAGANGPFAVLDSAVLNAPARLSVFHNCLEDNETRHQENYKGVPVMLLDYLVVTAMLLGTDVQEWLDRPQNVDGTVRIPGSSAHSVQKWLAIIHNEPLPASPVSPAETTASGGHGLLQRRTSLRCLLHLRHLYIQHSSLTVRRKFHRSRRYQIFHGIHIRKCSPQMRFIEIHIHKDLPPHCFHLHRLPSKLLLGQQLYNNLHQDPLGWEGNCQCLL